MKPVIHGGACGDSCCLRVQNLSVRIGNDTILDNLSLHVHCGQLLALIGPNGAGKSTFLKAILGQQEYDGVIAFSAPGQRSRKPRIGYVPQSPAFDPGDPVSVADLFICCQSRRPAFLGISKAMRESILECLDRVHGTDLIDKRVDFRAELAYHLPVHAPAPCGHKAFRSTSRCDARPREVLLQTHGHDLAASPVIRTACIFGSGELRAT